MEISGRASPKRCRRTIRRGAARVWERELCGAPASRGLGGAAKVVAGPLPLLMYI
jgi:hypothetical protein